MPIGGKGLTPLGGALGGYTPGARPPGSLRAISDQVRTKEVDNKLQKVSW